MAEGARELPAWGTGDHWPLQGRGQEICRSWLQSFGKWREGRVKVFFCVVFVWPMILMVHDAYDHVPVPHLPTHTPTHAPARASSPVYPPVLSSRLTHHTYFMHPLPTMPIHLLATTVGFQSVLRWLSTARWCMWIKRSPAGIVLPIAPESG